MNSAYRTAISQIESGGDYGLVGPATSSGDRAYGKYQVMGANIPEWTKTHLGTAMTPDQFLADKNAQDAVFDGQFGSYVSKYGNPQDAASAWFTGGPLSSGANKKDVLGTTGNSYVAQFTNNLNKGPMASNEDDEEDVPALSAQASLGRGTLFGPAGQPVNTAASIGSGLTGIGAALAGIASPQQAYSLNQQAQLINKQAKDKEVTYKTVVGKDGTVFRIGDDGSVQTANGQTKATSAPLGDPTKTGEEYLATLDPTKATYIKALVAGEIPPPTGKQLQSPEVMQQIDAAKRYDPTFDGSLWSARVAGRKEWNTKNAATVKSLNQAVEHTGALMDNGDALNNTQYPMWNTVKNALTEANGGAAPGNFRINAHALAEEYGKLFKANNLSDHEIKAWESNLGPNMSPEQQRGAMMTLRTLVQGSINALEGQRNTAVGPIASAKYGSMLAPESQKIFDKLDTWNAPKASAPSASALPKGVTSIKVLPPTQ